ncbi:hypothetical protein [Nocardia sp. X0981]
MSDTKDPRRNRRRASRTAGPPAESATNEPALGATGTGTPPTPAVPGPDAPGSATGAGTAAGAGSEAVAAAGETGGGDTGAASAGEKSAGAASESTEAAAPDTVRLEKTGTVRLNKEESEQAGSGAPAVATDESAEGEAAAEPAAATGGSWKRILALTAAAVLVIGLVGAAVVSVFAVQSTQQRDERRSEYVATARQTILNLTTIRADTAKEDIDRILTLASGEFKTEFDGRVDPFTEIVKQAKVVSTGEVVEAAVERDDEDSAVVLVAAKQTLTNAGSEEQQQRFYRFRVTVSRADDGTLTASDVEFVA